MYILPMEPVLQLISSGLGEFAKKIIRRSESIEETFKMAESVESSEIMDSDDSFKTADEQESPIGVKSAESSDQSIENVECLNSEPVERLNTDQVVKFSESSNVLAPSTSADPITSNVAVSPNQNNVSELSIRMVSTRYCQTGDHLAEAGVVQCLESIGVSVSYANMIESSQRPKLTESAVQTMEIGEELLSVQPAREPVHSELTETSPPESEKITVFESITSLVLSESESSFATADSSGKLASPECATTMNPPTSSELDASAQSAPTMVHMTQLVDNLSTKATDEHNLVESTNRHSSPKMLEKECIEEKTYSDLTPMKSAENINDSTKSGVKESAEANLGSFSQNSVGSLLSTSLTFDDHLLSAGRDSLFPDFNEFNDWFGQHGDAITFDGPYNDQLSMTNYGDVSSTNAVTVGGGEPTCSEPDFTNFTKLFREYGLDQALGIKTEPCKRPVSDQCRQSQSNPCKEPAVVKPNYPAVMAQSPDSTEDGLHLHVLPCEVIVPRMEKKFPQYAHLLREAIKRKSDHFEDSDLKNKIRSDFSRKIPLGSCKPHYSKVVSQLQRPGKKARNRDLPPSASKRTKTEKTRDSRESDERESGKIAAKQPGVVLRVAKSRIVGFTSHPKAGCTSHPETELPSFRKPNWGSYKTPRTNRITELKVVDGKKVSVLEKRDSSKRKLSDASDVSGSLRLKNVKVSLNRRDSGINSDETSVNNKELSSKSQSTDSKRRNSTDSARRKALVAETKSSSCKPSSPRRNERESASSEKLLRTGLQNHHTNVCEDFTISATESLPAMPELTPWEDDVGNRTKTDKRTSVQEIVQIVTTLVNSQERCESFPDPKKTEPSKCILKNRVCLRASCSPRVRFGDEHSFKLIDCDGGMWYPSDCLLPELNILKAINNRHSLAVIKAKLLALRWMHQCYSESQSIRSSLHESEFDCSECIDECSKKSFEEHIKKLIYSRIRKMIFDTEYTSNPENEIEFFIDMFDTSEKDCWKIILKREMDSQAGGKFEVGDILSLTLFTKSRNVKGKWKKTYIFGYAEEIYIKKTGEHQFQMISLCVDPMDHEVRINQVKIQTVVNIGEHLKLFTASSVVPYSQAVDLFTNVPANESKLDAPLFDDEDDVQSRQTCAVDLCRAGILSKNPFLYLVDGAPGTGKTHFIVKLILSLYSKELPEHFLKILVVTRTDASADDILLRFNRGSNRSTNFNILRYRDGKDINPLLKEYVLNDFNYILKKQNLGYDIDLEERILEAQKNAVEEANIAIKKPVTIDALRRRYISMINFNIEQINDHPAITNAALRRRYVEETVIGSADVVIISQDACYREDFLKNFTPCPSNGGIFHKFSVCIFDDANEISETDLWVPVMTMASKVILVGDSKIPSVRDSSLTSFTELLDKYKKSVPINTINFEKQFRIHPKILDCMGKMNLFKTLEPSCTELKLLLKPLMIIDLNCGSESLNYTKQFERQAKFCRNIVLNIRNVKEIENLRIGVLVGNKQQKVIVKEELKSCSPETFVDKAAAYCGLEKDIILVCLPALLYPEKFLYTAMTRAKRSLLICGDFSQFKGQEIIEYLIENATRRRCFLKWQGNPLDFPFRRMRLYLKTSEVTP